MEKQLYAKIFKWVSWALLIVSVVMLLVAFPKFGGAGEEGAVTMLLNWAYVMLGLALAAVLLVGLYITATNNPKGLIKIGLVILGACVVVLIASAGFRRTAARLQRPYPFGYRTQTH